MFIIKPKTQKDMAKALFILSYYNVRFEARSNGLHQSSVFLVVDEDTIEGQLQLAEMTFQFNFHQGNERLCEECKEDVSKNGEGNSTCGHLTFTHHIK